jgi:type III pantothenate kinase
MLLALDVGNTNITLGRLEGSDIAESWRLATNPTATASEIERALNELFDLDGVTEAVMASVVPAVGAALAELLDRRNVRLLVADANTIPIPVRVDRPGDVGADRLVNAFAAVRLYGAPAIVVDFGTATTFDAIDADGAYVGGAIAPGIQLGVEALAARTALLPRIELEQPARAIGTNTTAAMQSGAVFGYLGLVHELLARIEDELVPADAPGAKVILTGGLAASPWALDVFADEIDLDLTLRGLAILQAEVSAAARQKATA